MKGKMVLLFLFDADFSLFIMFCSQVEQSNLFLKAYYFKSQIFVGDGLMAVSTSL